MAIAGSDSATARTYAGVHRALRRQRGSAVGQPCVNCGRPADGWGLIAAPTHIGPHPDHGRKVRWSVHLDAYRPLCRSCNSLRDHGGSWSLCPAGHARVAWGTSGGRCRGCRRDARSRERAAKRAAQAGADGIAERVASTR